MHTDLYQYSAPAVTLASLKRKDQQKTLCPFEELDQRQVSLTKKKTKRKKRKDNPHASAISIPNVRHMYSICISANVQLLP